MSIKKEFLVEKDGKTFVLYSGLLDLAHEQGLKRIETMLIQIPNESNGNMAISYAVVETEKGIFTGIGDAAPHNVTRIMAQHICRLSETRAKARALRDAVNVGVAALEELGDDFDSVGVSNENHAQHEIGRSTVPSAPGNRPMGAQPERGQRPYQQAGNSAGGEQASEAQVRALYAIARREFQWTEDEVDAHARNKYGKATRELTKREASGFIDALKGTGGQ